MAVGSPAGLRWLEPLRVEHAVLLDVFVNRASLVTMGHYLPG